MPKRDGLDLPDSAFAPPPEEERLLELDPAWVAERAAKQTAAAEARKPKRQIAGVIVAVLLVAAVIAVVAWIVLKT